MFRYMSIPYCVDVFVVVVCCCCCRRRRRRRRRRRCRRRRRRFYPALFFAKNKCIGVWFCLVIHGPTGIQDCLASLCDTEMILVTTCICRSLMGQWQRLEFKWNVQNNNVVTSFSTWSCLTPLPEKHYLNPPLAQAFSSSWAIFWSGPCSRTISTDVTANLRLHKKTVVNIIFGSPRACI